MAGALSPILGALLPAPGWSAGGVESHAEANQAPRKQETIKEPYVLSRQFQRVHAHRSRNPGDTRFQRAAPLGLRCLHQTGIGPPLAARPARLDHAHLRNRSESRRRLSLSLAQTGRKRYGHGRNIPRDRSEEHTSELQSLRHLVCRLLLEK